MSGSTGRQLFSAPSSGLFSIVEVEHKVGWVIFLFQVYLSLRPTNSIIILHLFFLKLSNLAASADS